MRGSCRSRFRIYRTKQLDPQQLKPARPFAQDLSLSGTIHLVERSGNVPAGGAMSPFMTAFLGGLAGGASFALVLTLLLAIFGRPLAEGFFQQQVAFIEKRFKERIVDAVLGRIAGFLDQSERIGQIARRVLEIVQLIVNRTPLAEVTPGGAVGASTVARGHSTLGSAFAAMGKTDEARRSFEEALRLDPRDPGALQGLRDLGASP